MHIFVQLTSKLALGHKQPSVECVPGVFSRTQSWQSVSVTTQSHLVPMLRMADNIISTPPFIHPWHEL